ncbi:hypothetical protein LUW75_01260 [Streptomyces sp. MRC013]|nr:hypothetical protein [Streptomyces sp. MRC013]URM88873.1 hypothetical protein LUW75_01260 [Streptomyces sp. MRC013]
MARTRRPVRLARWWKNGVSTVPGSTVHTRRPRSPASRSSCRSEASNASSACFDIV